MSTTIIASPWPWTPVRQPAWLQIRGDDVKVNGTAAVFTITFADAAVASNSVSITCNGYTVEMVCAATMDDSGVSFAAAGTAIAAATSFVAGCLRNYYLTRDFIITRASAVVTFTARAKGTAYNPGAVVIDPAPLATYALTTTGVDQVREDNYSIRLRVWRETEWGSGSFEALPEQVGYLTDGNVKFDIATLLFPTPGLHAAWPDYGATSCLKALSLQCRYYLEFWEQFKNPSSPRGLFRVPDGPDQYQPAMYMGFRQRDRFMAENYFLFGMAIDGLYTPWWLTWRMRKDPVEVSPRQQHYLGWYMRYERTAPAPEDPGEDIAMQARITYTDGTSGSWTTRYVDDHTGLDFTEIGIWPTGWTELDMDSIANPAKTVWYYEVRLYATGAAEVISEVGRFYLVPEDANELHIEFINGLGCPESMRTKGLWVAGLEADYETVQRQLGVAPEDWESERGTEPLGAQETLRVSTGTVSGPDELRCLAEVLVSPEVRLVDHVKQTRYPLRLSRNTHLVRVQGDADKEHIYALNLEFLVGDPELVYSDVPEAE